MHAGFLHHWRTRLGESNQIRSATIDDFSRRLSLPLRYGAPLPYLRLPIFTRTAADRDRVYTSSRVRGLGMSLAYPSPVSDIPEIRALFEGQTFPTARRVAERLLTIPTHHWLSREDKDAIVECLNTPC
jgi:dTDP-4-amino-4,6-dideoxygalactose transaminase